MMELITYLKSEKAGLISDTTKLEKLLSTCWDEFVGSDVEGMVGDKLIERMGNVYWHPPILKFCIERHGGTVMGSSRADIHEWKLNIQEKTAICKPAGYRQIFPKKASLDVKSLAYDVAQRIINGQKYECLKWKDNYVQIQIGKINQLAEGSAIKQTLEDRRKRFRAEVERLLEKEGWVRIRPNIYTHPRLLK